MSASIGASAQNINRNVIQWQALQEDIAGRSSARYIEFMRAGQLDSAKSVLNDWQSQSNLSEPILRARILLAAKAGTYNDSVLPENIIDHIYLYRNRMGMIKTGDNEYYNNLPDYYGYISPGGEFDEYTQELAAGLKDSFAQGTDEYFWTDFYSGGEGKVFETAREGGMPVGKIAAEYNETVGKYINMGEYHFALSLGGWIPAWSMSAVGAHPEVGLQLGWKKKKFNYDLSLAFKFLDATKPYKTYTDYTGAAAYQTQTFVGFYAGFDFGYDIWSGKGQEMQLIGAVGVDWFKTLNPDIGYGRVNNMVAYSPFFGLGASYRWYVSNNMYIGVRLKYNFAHYPWSEIVRYSGHIVTLQFTVGLLGNGRRNSVLDALEYPYRGR